MQDRKIVKMRYEIGVIELEMKKESLIRESEEERLAIMRVLILG